LRRGGAGEWGMRLRVAPRRFGGICLSQSGRRQHKPSSRHCPPPSRTASELLPSRAALSNFRRHCSRSMSFWSLCYLPACLAASRQLRTGLAAAAARTVQGLVPGSKHTYGCMHMGACYPAVCCPAVQVAAACCAEIRRAVRVAGGPHAPSPGRAVHAKGV